MKSFSLAILFTYLTGFVINATPSIRIYGHIGNTGPYLECYPQQATNQCYNIDTCFNDQASSANWSQILRGSDSAPAVITFFLHKDCNIRTRSWTLDKYGGATDFTLDGFNDGASSFSLTFGDYLGDHSLLPKIDACDPTGPCRLLY